MRDTVQVSWGSAVQTEGTAGTETLDSIHLCSYSAPCFYRLFLVSYFSYFKNKTRWAALYSLHKTFSPCYFFLHSNSLRWRAWKLPPGCKSRNWDWEERSYSLVRLERKLRSFDSKGRIFFFLIGRIVNALLWLFGPREMNLIYVRDRPLFIFLHSF